MYVQALTHLFLFSKQLILWEAVERLSLYARGEKQATPWVDEHCKHINSTHSNAHYIYIHLHESS